MKRILITTLIYAASLYAQNTPAPSTNDDVWKPLRFLIGTWEAKTQGGSAGAVSTGTYTFQLELRSHVLARHAINEGCKSPADFDCEHGDLLYIYPATPGRSFKAIYFDNEGHIIHYDVSTPSTASVIFISDPSQAAPQYRLTYELKDNTMSGKFGIRMPARTEFTTYLEWSGGKK